jgi:hypothetical protein
MSLIDLDSLPPADLIAQYILELKGSGNILPYTDYECIGAWLKELSNDSDQLLLILSEILPNYFSPEKPNNKRRNLKGVDKSVFKAIKEMKMRNS